MKNVFRLLLASFVLLGMSSCTLMTDGGNLGEGSESLAFCFRAPTDPTGSSSNRKLTLSISDGTKTEIFETAFNGDIVSHEFNNVPVGKKISIYAKVEKTIINMPAAPDETELLYEGATDIVTKRGENVVNLGLDAFSGYFLWAGADYKVIYKSITPNVDLGSNTVEKPNDFVFDSNGNTWSFSSNTLEVYNHGRDKVLLEQDLTDLYTTGIVSGRYIAPFEDGVFVADGSSIEYFKKNPSDPQTLENGKYTVKQSKDSVILDIAASNTELFVAYKTEVTHEDKTKSNQFTIVKGTIDKENSSIDLTDINNQIFKSPNNEMIRGGSFFVTDMQVMDNDLYVLFIDEGKGKENTYNDIAYWNNNSRGGLLKISKSGECQILGLHNETYQKPKNLIYEVYVINETTNPNKSLNYFVGPRKFIALKPKKLVIADSGFVFENDTDSVSHIRKSKIVTVDTDSFAFENVVSLKKDLFDGKVETGDSGHVGYDADISY